MERKAVGKVFGALLVMLVVIAAGCVGKEQQSTTTAEQKTTTTTEQKTYTFHAALAVPMEDPYGVGIKTFADELEKSSNGRMKVIIHPAGELGSERDYIEAMIAGELDFAVIQVAPLAGYTDLLAFLDVPYLFTDENEAIKFIQSDLAQKVLSKLSTDIDIVGLAFGFSGFRDTFTAKKPILSVEDVKGLKIRTMENPRHLEFWRALGANPTPMAWGEVFTALQLGTIDAVENPLVIYYSTKIYELAPYYSYTHHIAHFSIYLVSKKTWDSLSPEDRELVLQAAQKASEAQINYALELQQKLESTLKEKGCQFYRVDIEEFKNALSDTRKDMMERIGTELQPKLGFNVFEELEKVLGHKLT